MNISIIEFGVYGFVAYLSVAMLITSMHKELPGGKTSTIARSIYMIPGIIASGILTYSGINITLQSGTVSNIIKDLNSTNTFSETATTTNTVILQNPIWIGFHFMLFLIMIIYVLIQMLQLLTVKTPKATE